MGKRGEEGEPQDDREILALRVVLGLKTIWKGEFDHKESFFPLFEEEQSYRTHLR